jgi:hypothetical protein
MADFYYDISSKYNSGWDHIKLTDFTCWPTCASVSISYVILKSIRAKMFPTRVVEKMKHTFHVQYTCATNLTDLKIIKQNTFFLLSPYNLETSWTYLIKLYICGPYTNLLNAITWKTLKNWNYNKSNSYQNEFLISRKCDTQIWWWKN